MAGVFLSYARDDTPKARQIAAALEKAGHSVWWDLHVRGGTQFSKVIEEALKSADVVVVLWSERSVDSPWVRDEAASGRDRGRLVPVALDKTEPPLGFRQFQTIDLSGWKGRGTVPRLPEILHSIDGALGEEGVPPRPSSDARPAMPRMPEMSRSVRLGLLTLLVFAAIAVAYFLINRDVKSGVHTAAITAPDARLRPLAQDLLVQLSGLQSVQEGSMRLLEEVGKERPDLILEVRTAGTKQSYANLVLIDGQDRAVLWTKDFDRGSGSRADLEQRMVFTAGRVLACAVEGFEGPGKALEPQILGRYLVGCSAFAEASNETMPSVIPLFEQVVRDAPGFEGAWAKLLLAESHIVSSMESTEQQKETLRRHIRQARDLNANMPEATLAQVTLLPTRAFGDALRLLDRAKENDRGNALILGHRSLALANVGRMSEAVDDAREASRLDPTSPEALSNYVLTLAHSGRVEAARAELGRAERLWSGTGRLADLQFAFTLRYGDPKEYLKSDAFKQASSRGQMFHRIRADPTPANVDRFIANFRELYDRRGLTMNDLVGHAQAYGELHREDDYYNLISRFPPGTDLSPMSAVIFRPSMRRFRQDPRFMIVAKRAGLVDYWTKSGKWPDFCFDPDQPYDCKAEAAKLS